MCAVFRAERGKTAHKKIGKYLAAAGDIALSESHY
jgi:hypothetical protein